MSATYFETFPFRDASLAFAWFIFLLETWLSLRQHARYTAPPGTRVIPKELKGVVDEKVFQSAQSYNKDRSSFGLVKSLYDQIEGTLIILLGGFPFVWNIAGSTIVENWLGYESSSEHEIIQSLAFIYIFSLFSFVTSLPWNIYSTFVIEEKHGFNKQTLGFFLWDKIKELILTLILTPIIVAPLIAIIQWGGEYFYFYVWSFLLVFGIVMLTIYPVLIAPLFDKYVPLPESELKSRIETLARNPAIQFPLVKIFVVLASKRSSHSNAYFYGFFKNKRIVLFDTLLDDSIDLGEPSSEKERITTTAESIDSDDDAYATHGHSHGSDSSSSSSHGHGHGHSHGEKTRKIEPCTTEEILGVLAHELGHWKLNHTLKNFIISQAINFASFAFFGQLMYFQPMFSSFGFPTTTPTLIGILIVFQYIFRPAYAVLTFILTALSRHYEFQADAFADKLGYGSPLRSALVKLQKNNLSDMDPDPLYSLYHYSHPPLVERLAAIGGKED